jgi:Putative DNA-binding domain
MSTNSTHTPALLHAHVQAATHGCDRPGQGPLALEQQALLQALAAPRIQDATDLVAAYASFQRASGINDHENPLTRGLQAYRANANAMAERALLAAYPVLQQLLGEETFAMLARDLWAAHPPERGDLAQWGAALARYLDHAPALAELVTDHPYLPDVTRLEWALHSVATAADASQDTASFALLASQPPEALHLRLASGTQLLHSAYPIVAIWQAHAVPTPDLSEAMRLLAEGVGQTAMVWRQGYAPRVAVVGPGEAAILRCALTKDNLSQAVAQALAKDAGFDLSAWLTLAVQRGVLLGMVHTQKK